MCARTYMFGDESTFGSCSKNMPKKGQQEWSIHFLLINLKKLKRLFNII